MKNPGRYLPPRANTQQAGFFLVKLKGAGQIKNLLETILGKPERFSYFAILTDAGIVAFPAS